MEASLTTEKTETLAEQLKRQTTTVHESLDKRIIRARPFDSEQNYLGFLKMQLCFHWLVRPLFNDPNVAALMGNISHGCRFDQVVQDCLDLNLNAEQQQQLLASVLPLQVTTAEAVGWIYTIEGSNIGGAFLFKMAKQIGLNEDRGALHLAGHIDGRAKHWREVKQCINQLDLDSAEQQQMIAGARDAFSFVRHKVEEFLPACD